MLTLQSFTFNGFSENTYLLSNEKNQCWIIDPGMYDARENSIIHNLIAYEGFSLQAIINTHSHVDHIFGVEEIMKKYKVPFHLHEAEMPVLKNARGAAMLFGMNFGNIMEPTDFIKIDETLMLGEDEIEVLFVPGHSPGSVAFYYPKGGWVIAGDALFAGSIGRTDLPGGHHETLIKSIKTQLLSLPGETVVHSGHGPSTTIAAEKKSNPFLQ